MCQGRAYQRARYEGGALSKQKPAKVAMVPTFNDRLEQAVAQSSKDRQRGNAEGYAAAAELAKRMGLADYLGDSDPNDDLSDRASNAFDDEAPGCSRSWHTGYLSGLEEFRSDLKNYEYDEAAEKRLVAAGVTL